MNLTKKAKILSSSYCAHMHGKNLMSSLHHYLGCIDVREGDHVMCTPLLVMALVFKVKLLSQRLTQFLYKIDEIKVCPRSQSSQLGTINFGG